MFEVFYLFNASTKGIDEHILKEVLRIYLLSNENLASADTRWTKVESQKRKNTSYRLFQCACGSKPTESTIKRQRRRYQFANCLAFAQVYYDANDCVYRVQGYFEHSEECSRFVFKVIYNDS
jgi:hypothetical protein